MKDARLLKAGRFARVVRAVGLAPAGSARILKQPTADAALMNLNG
jgi:hypothetical protein